MTVQTGPNSHQRGLELAEAGRHPEALNCLQEHLRCIPNDAEALNDAGAVLHCLGRHADAISYLVKARSLRGDDSGIVWNLVEAYLAAGLPTEAASLFDAMHRIGILNVDVLNRTATLMLDQGKKGQAIETLLRSYRLWPEQEVLKGILDIVRGKRPKIVCFRSHGGRDHSLADTWSFVQERFQVRFCDNPETDDIVALMSQHDVAWFDGGGPHVVAACERPFTGKILVSLRRSDVHGDWVQQVRWENVDILVQIGGPVVEEVLLAAVPDIRNRTRLVRAPGAMNLDGYVLRQRTRGKNLACMGRLSFEANLGFLVQCMQKLHYVDRGYRLFVAGTFESPLLGQYVQHMVNTLGLSDVVSFEPYPGDVNAWLSDKHFIVSAGMGEDQAQTVLAGMATGLKPIVHNFTAAASLFPQEYLFNISEEFCERVLSADYEPALYRRFVEERYPAQEQLKRMDGVLTQLETEIDLQTSSMGVDSSAGVTPIQTRLGSGWVAAGAADTTHP